MPASLPGVPTGSPALSEPRLLATVALPPAVAAARPAFAAAATASAGGPTVSVRDSPVARLAVPTSSVPILLTTQVGVPAAESGSGGPK